MANATPTSLRRSTRNLQNRMIIKDSEGSENEISSPEKTQEFKFNGNGKIVQNAEPTTEKITRHSSSLINPTRRLEHDKNTYLPTERNFSQSIDVLNTPTGSKSSLQQQKRKPSKRKRAEDAEDCESHQYALVESHCQVFSTESPKDVVDDNATIHHLSSDKTSHIDIKSNVELGGKQVRRKSMRLRVGVESNSSNLTNLTAKAKGKEKALVNVDETKPDSFEISEDFSDKYSVNSNKFYSVPNSLSHRKGENSGTKEIKSSLTKVKNQGNRVSTSSSILSSRSPCHDEIFDSDLPTSDAVSVSASGYESFSSNDEPQADNRARRKVLLEPEPEPESEPGARTVARRRSTRIPKENRAMRDRKLLESHHPEMKTMWEDLENLPKIGDVTMDQPENISRELKPFQLQGVAWMKAMEKTRWGGGLLGDEMGMGKTIQAVSLIMSDWPMNKPSLVLIPPVALLQWQQEIDSYTGGALKTFVYHGTNLKTKGISKDDIMEYDVILMSYNSLESVYRKQEKGFKRKDGLYKEKSVIHQTRFHRVILDEAHNIKSRSTGSAKACFALKADHKWCLSGTPLQNRIGEFFSLIRFLDIKPFTCYFCKRCPCSTLNWEMNNRNRCISCNHNGMQHISVFNYELLNPIQKYGNNGPGAEAFRKLRILTDRFMLRRVKRDYTTSMELPAKEIHIDRQFFGEEENDFAASIMNQGTRKFETYVAQGVLLNNYANIFGLILQMRQVADHPDLILKKNSEGGQNVLVCCICDETAEEAIRSACRHDFCRECARNYTRSSENPDCPQCHIQLSIDLEQPDIEQDEVMVKKSSIINRIKMKNWTSSTKIEALVHELYKLRSKNMSHKSIIFSQFTTMLQLVEWRLRRAGITTVMLDGSMTPSQRQASINHFMTDVNVECFLVSLKAGGVALNLTEASKVFIVDPWWNPAAEWQSADRCHRIGQSRPCSITRLCIEDSVESRMVLLQEKKANMINSTINADDSAMESLTPEDMQFLFRGS
ncbi:DNA repair protein RAD16 [Golovinomyces cichoracearum]|uniref:DNA repair protein RAD16 n=1 Tax=Golovinomyces cichoracearum TaxID=62708 RepID=A0A420IN57_9PEZI|nr:DNA repair protein RAD16 [Golovinomyces cichoracearum]